MKKRGGGKDKIDDRSCITINSFVFRTNTEQLFTNHLSAGHTASSEEECKGDWRKLSGVELPLDSGECQAGQHQHSTDTRGASLLPRPGHTCHYCK